MTEIRKKTINSYRLNSMYAKKCQKSIFLTVFNLFDWVHVPSTAVHADT